MKWRRGKQALSSFGNFPGTSGQNLVFHLTIWFYDTKVTLALILREFVITMRSEQNVSIGNTPLQIKEP